MHKPYCSTIAGFDILLQNIQRCSNFQCFHLYCLALEGNFVHFYSTNSSIFSSVALQFPCLGSWNAFWDESDASSNSCVFSLALYFLFHDKEFSSSVTVTGFFCMLSYQQFKLIYWLQHIDWCSCVFPLIYREYFTLGFNNLTWTRSVPVSTSVWGNTVHNYCSSCVIFVNHVDVADTKDITNNFSSCIWVNIVLIPYDSVVLCQWICNCKSSNNQHGNVGTNNSLRNLLSR